jgi:SAM-dependent MidA family methyltransferase
VSYRPWAEAWQEALYGPAGFYRRTEGPAGHFRTAAHASPSLLGAALARLARAIGCDAVVDVGAGRGELLTAVHRADGELALTGVDVADRPRGLPDAVGWSREAPGAMPRTLLVGWELLDVVPCSVLGVDDGPARVVEVDDEGHERLGGFAERADVEWSDRWWPGAAGGRIEVGRPRDELWTSLVDRVTDGLALAVDYGHTADGRPASGTLTGYRAGRQVRPVPDGSCDITAHVALDSLGGVLLPQRRALRHLGVQARRPLPSSDAAAYLAALATSSEAAELLDPGGLGGFGWVLHPRGDAAYRLVTEWTRGAPA